MGKRRIWHFSLSPRVQFMFDIHVQLSLSRGVIRLMASNASLSHMTASFITSHTRLPNQDVLKKHTLESFTLHRTQRSYRLALRLLIPPHFIKVRDLFSFPIRKSVGRFFYVMFWRPFVQVLLYHTSVGFSNSYSLQFSYYLSLITKFVVFFFWGSFLQGKTNDDEGTTIAQHLTQRRNWIVWRVVH